MNIFFDLDGTLIDSKARLYRLFQHLVPISIYTFEQYWDLKQNRVGHKEILSTYFNYSEDQFLAFEKLWMDLIESDTWLNFDHPFEGVSARLSELSKEHKLYVVTARQSPSIAYQQLDRFGWTGFFEKIFVTGQKVEKIDLINNSVKVSAEDWFIGDTGKDIQTGKLLGIHTAAVLTGFLSKRRLMEYNPDVIVDNILALTFK